AILEKSDAAEGFDQIIDFLSGSYIHYALTVNPHIYISCIKQFWNTASVKRSDDATRLQALVDKKKIVISEAVIREILQLNDAEGVVRFPNEEIFVGLAQMRYEKPSTKLTFYKVFFSSQWKFLIHAILQSLSAKRTSWNEFSTAMASAVICLSKGVETPLFEGMLAVGQPAEEGLVADQVQRVENLENDNATQKLEIVQLKARVKKLEKANKLKSSKLRRLRKLVKDAEVAESEGHAEKHAQIYNLDLDHSSKFLSMQEDDLEVQEVVEVVTTAKLITEVVTAAASQVSAASITIPAASATIPAAKLTIPVVAPTVVDAYTRRRKGVIIRDPEEELPLKTPTETPKVKDKGKGILVETLSL
nr:hypothetical protein [Tanacetum cinerariifolium]